MENHDRGTSAISLLYVEDDPDARRIACLLIAHRFPGLVLLRAENGQEGLELFRQQRPQIVITDLNMPVMDGIRMAKEIRAVDPDACIIAVTAHSDQSFLDEAAGAGIGHYLQKPMDRNKLFQVVEQCIVEIGPTKGKG